MHSRHSLAERGEKNIEKKTVNLTALTHSYTITPTLVITGQLMSPLAVILQERDAVRDPATGLYNFGPQVYFNTNITSKH